MTLKGQIQDDMKHAMKAGDRDRLKVVRLILAAIKQVEVDERKELADDDVLRVLDKMLKQRRDSADQYEKAGRADLAEIERAEIAVIEAYMPPALSDEELDALVEGAIRETGATGMRDMGKVMSRVRADAAGRADMAAVGSKVKARLGQPS